MKGGHSKLRVNRVNNGEKSHYGFAFKPENTKTDGILTNLPIKFYLHLRLRGKTSGQSCWPLGKSQALSPRKTIICLYNGGLDFRNERVMYKYEGLLVYESHDDDGILEVVELDGVRSLHFGSHPRQSSMLLKAPERLALEYVRAMTSWLLFKETLAEDGLIIGLGGGSITKHLLQHFPDCRLTVVESRKGVVKIARSHFGLPLDPRLKIIVDDGGHYVRNRAETHRERYGLMVVDAFDHEGMAASISNQAFFDACQAMLKDDGILVINLWGGTSNPAFQSAALWLGRAFGWKLLFLPVTGRGNIIGLAFNSSLPAVTTTKNLRARAAALEQQFDIDFPAFLRDLKKHNASTLKQVIKT
ncbi:MAG: spermine synthase [Methylobacter sp.]|nr:MAG: spermine synthase [Methylobacter sp.]